MRLQHHQRQENHVAPEAAGAEVGREGKDDEESARADVDGRLDLLETAREVVAVRGAVLPGEGGFAEALVGEAFEGVGEGVLGGLEGVKGGFGCSKGGGVVGVEFVGVVEGGSVQG